MNGSGFGPIANHSLVMASYISRANAAVIDLRNLLARGKRQTFTPKTRAQRTPCRAGI